MPFFANCRLRLSVVKSAGVTGVWMSITLLLNVIPSWNSALHENWCGVSRISSVPPESVVQKVDSNVDIMCQIRQTGYWRPYVLGALCDTGTGILSSLHILAIIFSSHVRTISCFVSVHIFFLVRKYEVDHPHLHLHRCLTRLVCRAVSSVWTVCELSNIESGDRTSRDKKLKIISFVKWDSAVSGSLTTAVYAFSNDKRRDVSERHSGLRNSVVQMITIFTEALISLFSWLNFNFVYGSADICGASSVVDISKECCVVRFPVFQICTLMWESGWHPFDVGD